MDIYTGTTLIDLDVSKWSGRTKAVAEDYGLTVGELPPAEFVTLGTKKIFDSKKLAWADSRRKEAKRACLEVGTRRHGGFLVHNGELANVVEKLDDINARFLEQKSLFMSTFDQELELWIDQNRRYEAIIRARFDRDVIASRFSFGYELSECKPKESGGVIVTPADQVLHEVSVMCETLADTLADRTQAIKSEDLRSKFDPMVKKLRLLAFGDGRLDHLADELELMQSSIDAGLSIEPGDDPLVWSITFLSACSSETRLAAILRGDYGVKRIVQSATGVQAPADAEGSNVTLAQAGGWF